MPPRTAALALALTLALALAPSATAKAPVQVKGCPVVSYFHGAKTPHAVEGGYDATSWLTWANNALVVTGKPQTLDQLAKHWTMKRPDLEMALCGTTVGVGEPEGDAAPRCSTGMVPYSNDGFADTYALAIRVGAANAPSPRFHIHEDACVDWEKERVATRCDGGQIGGFAYVAYSVAGGDEDEEDDLVWDQLFDAKTGKLLLSTSDTRTPGERETPGITVSKDGATVTVGTCARWSAAALLAGKAPAGSEAVPSPPAKAGKTPKAKAKTLVTAGRRATKAGDFAAAITHFSAAIAVDAGALKAWSGRGYAYLQANQPTKALADFEHLQTHHAAEMDARFTKMVKYNVSQARAALKASAEP